MNHLVDGCLQLTVAVSCLGCSASLPRGLDASMLAPGLHVVAVEVHPADPASSDIVFDMGLDVTIEQEQP